MSDTENAIDLKAATVCQKPDRHGGPNFEGAWWCQEPDPPYFETTPPLDSDQRRFGFFPQLLSLIVSCESVDDLIERAIHDEIQLVNG